MSAPEKPVSAAKKPDYTQPPRFAVASSPHISTSDSVRGAMLDVLIALVPALGVSIYFFGPRALILTLVSIAACVLFEALYCALLKKKQTIGDLSACVTGILMAMCLPVLVPYWMAVIGAFFAIVVVKQLFGGLGKNFLNPALAARAFLMLCYPVNMTTWVLPGTDNWASLGMSAVDAVTSATPLSADFMHSGVLPNASLWDLLIGNIGGTVGEISALMLLLGGLYLLARKVIHIRIPLAFIGTVAVLTFLFPLGGNARLTWMLYEILGGGLFLGAFFMATDYVTSPVTPKGEVIFGVGCGLLTVFIRYFGGYPEGVSYAILLMNICVWLIDKNCKPRRFGVTSEMKKAAKAEKGGAGK